MCVTTFLQILPGWKMADKVKTGLLVKPAKSFALATLGKKNGNEELCSEVRCKKAEG